MDVNANLPIPLSLDWYQRWEALASFAADRGVLAMPMPEHVARFLVIEPEPEGPVGTVVPLRRGAGR